MVLDKVRLKREYIATRRNQLFMVWNNPILEKEFMVLWHFCKF